MDHRLGTVPGSFVSRHGESKAAWDGSRVKLSTPVEAELHLPGRPVGMMAPGEYCFTIAEESEHQTA